MRWSRRLRHEPETDAARYLAGEMRPRTRRAFEQHMLGCDGCWREVRAGQAGRAVAEAGREIAPAALREDVRAAVTLSSEPSRSRRRLVLGGALAVTVAALLVSGLLIVGHGRGQPAAIEAALASYRSAEIRGGPAELAPPDLAAAGLTLVGSGSRRLGDLPVDAYAYRGRGSRVVVFLSRSPFPEARGATEHGGVVHGWHARDDGISLVCGDASTSYLMVGRNPQLLARAEHALWA